MSRKITINGPPKKYGKYMIGPGWIRIKKEEEE